MRSQNLRTPRARAQTSSYVAIYVMIVLCWFYLCRKCVTSLFCFRVTVTINHFKRLQWQLPENARRRHTYTKWDILPWSCCFIALSCFCCCFCLFSFPSVALLEFFVHANSCFIQFSLMVIIGALRSYSIVFLSQGKRLQFQPVNCSRSKCLRNSFKLSEIVSALSSVPDPFSSQRRTICRFALDSTYAIIILPHIRFVYVYTGMARLIFAPPQFGSKCV